VSAAIAMQPHVTVLPPGPQRAELTTEFFDRGERVSGRYPVSARAEAGEEFSSPGIAFEDYSRMHQQQRKQSGGRRLPTPAWALRPDLCRAVIVHYIERRANINKPQPGTERERLERASKRNTERCKRKEAVLRKLCAEFVELKKSGADPARANNVAEQIKNLDTCLRVDRNIAGIALRCVHLYYGAGLDSVGVATEMGLKPPHVRALIWKLNWCWGKMHGTAKPRWREERIPSPTILNPDQARADYPSIMPKIRKTKSSGIGIGTILKHVEILRKLAANNGGQIPTYTWLNANGFFRSYEIMRMYPTEFNKAGLYKS
jgi:hypothetical protein